METETNANEIRLVDLIPVETLQKYRIPSQKWQEWRRLRPMKTEFRSRRAQTSRNFARNFAESRLSAERAARNATATAR